MLRDRLLLSRRHRRSSMSHEQFHRPRVAFGPIPPQSSLGALDRREPTLDPATQCSGIFRPVSDNCETTLRQIRARTAARLLPTYSRCISQGMSARSHRCKPLLHGELVGQHPCRCPASRSWQHPAFLSRVTDGRRTTGG